MVIKVVSLGFYIPQAKSIVNCMRTASILWVNWCYTFVYKNYEQWAFKPCICTNGYAYAKQLYICPWHKRAVSSGSDLMKWHWPTTRQVLPYYCFNNMQNSESNAAIHRALCMVMQRGNYTSPEALLYLQMPSLPSFLSRRIVIQCGTKQSHRCRMTPAQSDHCSYQRW